MSTETQEWAAAAQQRSRRRAAHRHPACQPVKGLHTVCTAYLYLCLTAVLLNYFSSHMCGIHTALLLRCCCCCSVATASPMFTGCDSRGGIVFTWWEREWCVCVCVCHCGKLWSWTHYNHHRVEFLFFLFVFFWVFFSRLFQGDTHSTLQIQSHSFTGGWLKFEDGCGHSHNDMVMTTEHSWHRTSTCMLPSFTLGLSLIMAISNKDDKIFISPDKYFIWNHTPCSGM